MKMPTQQQLLIGALVVVLLVAAAWFWQREGYEGPNFGWHRADYMYGAGEHPERSCHSRGASCDIQCQHIADGRTYMECMRDCGSKGVATLADKPCATCR